MRIQGKTVVNTVEPNPIISDNYGTSSNDILFMERGIPKMSVGSVQGTNTSQISAFNNNSLSISTNCQERIKIPAQGIRNDNTSNMFLCLMGTELVFRDPPTQTPIDPTIKSYFNYYLTTDNTTPMQTNNTFGTYQRLAFNPGTLNPSQNFTSSMTGSLFDGLTLDTTDSAKFFLITYTVSVSVQTTGQVDIGTRITLGGIEIPASVCYSSIVGDNQNRDRIAYTNLSGSFISSLSDGDVLTPEITANFPTILVSRFSLTGIELMI